LIGVNYHCPYGFIIRFGILQSRLSHNRLSFYQNYLD
jgi:hypothetical protein